MERSGGLGCGDACEDEERSQNFSPLSGTSTPPDLRHLGFTVRDPNFTGPQDFTLEGKAPNLDTGTWGWGWDRLPSQT